MIFIAALLFAAMGLRGGAAALEESVFYQPYADSMVSALSLQRTFRSTLPSVAESSQSVHGPWYPGQFAVGASKDCLARDWVLWGTPFLAWEKWDATGTEWASKTKAAGLAAGLSRRFGENSVVGLALGYDNRDQYGPNQFVGGVGTWNTYFKNNADTLHTALYGGTSFGSLFLDAYAGWSRSWNDTGYDIAHPSVGSGSGNSKYDTDIYSAGVKASYVFRFGSGLRLIPSVGLDYSHVRQDALSVNVNNSTSALIPVGTVIATGGKASWDTLQLPIMVALNRTFESRGSWWMPEVRGGWVPQFGKKQAVINGHVLNVNTANRITGNLKSHGIGDSYGVLGAGVKVGAGERFTFAVNYDFLFGKDYRKHVVTGTVGWNF